MLARSLVTRARPAVRVLQRPAAFAAPVTARQPLVFPVSAAAAPAGSSAVGAVRGKATDAATSAAAAAGAQDPLMRFAKASTMREVWHYTSYSMAVLVPVALVTDNAITTVCDYAFAFAIPMHFHFGMRSVIVDYVHGLRMPAAQKGALYALAAATVLTTLGLLKLNVTDVGVTRAVKSLWKKPKAVKDEDKA